MNLYVGTSGYSYKEWKGSFYPEKLPAKEMLSYYSSRLPAVEINNTFYRLPQRSMLENWKEQVPSEFRFSVKASQKDHSLQKTAERGRGNEILARDSRGPGRAFRSGSFSAAAKYEKGPVAT